MTRTARCALALLGALLVTLIHARAARAQDAGRPAPVYVLTISTDDADDQAEALTQALRSRVRQLRAWSLQETTQSFETLSIALKCPAKPDGNCLQRIADQLHVDRFVWGTMSKKSGQVAAEVHMWARGKGDVAATEAYSDNLKDASDESLRTIAFKLFNAISGTTVGRSGIVVVHAGSATGDVLVDGDVKGQLDHGLARVDVPAGNHHVTVSVDGVRAPERAVSVSIGSEQELTFATGAPAAAAPVESASSGVSTKRILAYAALGVGGALLIGAGIEAAQWVNDSNSNHDDRLQVPKTVQDVCASQVNAAAADACKKSQDATTASTVGWVLGSAGAVLVGSGIVLLLTDHPSTEGGPAHASAKPAKGDLLVLPAFGPTGGGLDVRLTF